MRKRKCTACGEVKALGEFYIHRRSPGGRHAACKKCHRADVDARRRRRRLEDPADFLRRRRAACQRYARTAKGRAAGAAAARRYRRTAKARARRAARIHGARGGHAGTAGHGPGTRPPAAGQDTPGHSEANT